MMLHPFVLALLCPPVTSSDCSSCRIPGIGPVGPMVRVCTGFVYAEGPVVDAQGNLYFTDQRDGDGKIYRLDKHCKLELIVACSGRANGLALNRDGELVACQAIGRVVAYQPDGSSCRVVASGYCGRRFNAPNDLVIDRHGGIYFTDPYFGAPRPFPPQRCKAVYYVSPQGEVSRLIDYLNNPNGIGLSPDEKTLYVVPSLQSEVMAYTVTSPGKIDAGRVLTCMVRARFSPLYVGGDGMAVDVRGNLYIASKRGVQIFDPEGRLLGILNVPERASNCAFGGPERKTLYITARHSIYAVPLAVAGL